MFSGVYYIKKDVDGLWKSGTIVSNRSIRVVAFAEDVDVRISRRREAAWKIRLHSKRFGAIE